MMIVDPSEAGEQIRAGKFRAIAQVSERRLPGFPDIPTLKEAGFDIPERAADARRRRRARHVGRRGRLLRGPVLQGQQDRRRGRSSSPRASSTASSCARPSSSRSSTASRAAARDPEGGRRQGGAVGTAPRRCRPPRERATQRRPDAWRELEPIGSARDYGSPPRGDDADVRDGIDAAHSAARFCTSAAAALS